MNEESSTLDVLPEVESGPDVAPVPTCATGGCKSVPVARYTWPGAREALVCLAHALTAKRVAAACGFDLQVQRAELGGVEG